MFVHTLQGLLGCHSTYDLKLKYDRSQKVTHDLIKQFYNGLILYQQFIEYLTNQEIKHILKTNLANITGGLDHNIARLYHLVSLFCVKYFYTIKKYLIWLLTYVGRVFILFIALFALCSSTSLDVIACKEIVHKLRNNLNRLLIKLTSAPQTEKLVEQHWES